MHRVERAITFNVPAASGQYAPEVLYCNIDNDVRTGMDVVKELTQHIESLPAGATIEIDLLKAGGAAGNTADWMVAVFSVNAIGFVQPRALGGWRGVRVRAKSGGTAGPATVHSVWNSQAA